MSVVSSSNFAENPVQQIMKVIITEPQFHTADPKSKLAKVTSEEGQCFMSLNAAGVKEFFIRKECADIGNKLFTEQIDGCSLSYMKEADLRELKLSLGERLAMQSFLQGCKRAARRVRRNEEIWSTQAYVPGIEKVGAFPCFGSCSFSCPECNCGKKPVELVSLPQGSYKLTASSLRVLDYKWADNHAEMMRPRDFKPAFPCVGGCCGWIPKDPPAVTEFSQNIEMRDVTSVDSFNHSVAAEKYKPTCMDTIWGWRQELRGTPAAQVLINYKSAAGQIVSISLALAPDQVVMASGHIIAAMEEAQVQEIMQVP